MFASVNARSPAFTGPATSESKAITDPRQQAGTERTGLAEGKQAERPDAPGADKRVQPSSKSEKTGNEKKPSDAKLQEGEPSAGGEELSESEEKQVRELKKRDQEVRAHEQAHATVGGSYASAPKYEFTVGPDGKRYATSGEVKIDASPVRDNPKATIRKMEIVIRAALAPAEPSPQDQQVARQAQETRAKAQAELAKQEQDGREGAPNPAQSDPASAEQNLVRQVTALYNEAAERGESGEQSAKELGAQLFLAA